MGLIGLPLIWFSRYLPVVCASVCSTGNLAFVGLFFTGSKFTGNNVVDYVFHMSCLFVFFSILETEYCLQYN